MITSVQKINHKCEDCGKPAMVIVTRTNDELPPKYFQHGKRQIYYCKYHIPQDVKNFWNNLNSDLPNQKL